VTFNGGLYDTAVSTIQVAQVMHVKSIDPGYEAQGTGYVVGARIKIVYGNGAPVSGATLKVKLIYPDSSSVKLTGRTNSQGKVTVAQAVTDTGTYTFTVLSVTRPPALYDPNQNIETSDSVTIP